jgi:DNA (cytosine-5)-methyltransferase 1
MKILDLFAGVGGFSLAAHWMGWETVGFVEWEKYNKKVLAKNFPNTPIHGDITTYNGTLHEADIITGGFPCQPFSTAGKREGTNDSRYLWPEMLRVIREVQPTYVIGENVAGIYSMDNGSVFEQVCTDLEDEGYAVQPFRIPACATGAPHRRDRWWFVAVKNSDSSGNGRVQTERGIGEQRDVKSAVQVRASTNSNESDDRRHYNNRGFQSEAEANESEKQRKERNEIQRKWGRAGFGDGVETITNPNTNQARLQRPVKPNGGKGEECNDKQYWGRNRERPYTWPQVATRLCRVDDGLPAWVDRHRTNRLKSLGNSIQPQVAYQIFKALNRTNETN